MATAKPNKPNAGGNAPAPPPASQGTAPAPAKEKRKRNALSPQKQFAIAIAGLVAIFVRKEVAAQLTVDEKAKIEAANKLASDLNAKTIDPVKNRIAAIRTEMQEIGKKMSAPDADIAALAAQTTDLSKELQRKVKQLEQLTSAAAG